VIKQEKKTNQWGEPYEDIQEDNKLIGMKICDSDWTDMPFDITKL